VLRLLSASQKIDHAGLIVERRDSTLATAYEWKNIKAYFSEVYVIYIDFYEINDDSE